MNMIQSAGSFSGLQIFRCLNGARRATKTWVKRGMTIPCHGIVDEDLEKLESAPWEVRSKGYDLVLNGRGAGLGEHPNSPAGCCSERLFARRWGLTEEQLRRRFGFFLDALTYGTPPHGGIALGLDRVTMAAGVGRSPYAK